MWILKIAGAVLLIFSGTIYGFKMGDEYVKRISSLKDMKKYMILLDGELKYNKTPIRLALGKISLREKSSLHKFLKNVSEIMTENPLKNLKDAFEESAFILEEDESYLRSDDIKKLMSFAGTVVNLDDESTHSSFECYIKELDMDICEALSDKDNKVKIYRTIGVMAGMLVTVIIV